MSSKAREALEEASVALAKAVHFHLTEEYAKECLASAKAAIAKPLRNCDVGTAEEQAIRFESYCDSHINCGHCPLVGQQCVLAWSQLPYEEVK